MKIMIKKNNYDFKVLMINNITEKAKPCDWISDLVDLWVIKIKKNLILCARTTSRSREQSRKRKSSSENMRKVYSP